MLLLVGEGTRKQRKHCLMPLGPLCEALTLGREWKGEELQEPESGRWKEAGGPYPLSLPLLPNPGSLAGADT